jgi:hypothetical protein
LSKKANLSLSTPLVDFGPGVILGESVTKTLTLSNDGALDVDYSIACEVRGAWLTSFADVLHKPTHYQK